MHLWRRVSTTLMAGLAFALIACGGSGDSIQGEQNAEISTDLNSDTVRFGSVNVGEQTTEQVEIENAGSDDLELRNLDIEERGDDVGREFRTAGDKYWDGTTIAPGESIELGVTYAPRNYTGGETNPDTGEIVIDSNDARYQEEPFTIDFDVQGLAPELAPDPESSVTFSAVEPNSTAAKSLTLTNEGSSDLKIDDIAVSGEGSGDFALRKYVEQEDSSGDGEGGEDGEGDGDGGDDEESGGNAALNPDNHDPISEVTNSAIPPDESVRVEVFFEPKTEQAVEAEITIFSNDPVAGEKDIALTGNSGTPCLGLSHQDEINFGSTSTDNTATTTVTVQNCRSQADNLVLENIEVANNDDGAFEVTSLPGEMPDREHEIEGDGVINFVVEFTPSESATYNGELVIDSNDQAYPDGKTIDLIGKGNDNPCPNAEAVGRVKADEGGSAGEYDNEIDALPLDTIEFDGTESTDPGDGSIERYEWSIIDRPADSTARLTPSSNVEQPELFLDLAGEYTVELVAYDDEGAQSCGDRALVEITAIPDEDIHVQLVWDTPSDPDETDDDGTDLDLHYMHPEATSWNQAPFDIFWNNKEADWDEDGTPSLDIDDTDGAGPENINHDNPGTHGYTVGVYYYQDNGFGPSYATVRIYVRGQLAQEYKNKYMEDTYDFWKVGVVDWPSGNVYKRDEMFEDFPNTSGGGG